MMTAKRSSEGRGPGQTKRIISRAVFFSAAVLAFMGLAAIPTRAQRMTPEDDRQKARFEAVSRAVEKRGYAGAIVVGSSGGTTPDLFALLATRNGKGVLIAAVEPAGTEPVLPAELESDQTPVDLGIAGVRFGPFLGTDDLIEAVVSHHPFRLETTMMFDRHFVLRRSGNSLTVVGDFEGDSTSTTAKGYRTVAAKRTGSVEKVAGASPLQFDLKTVQITTEQSGQGPAVVLERSENVKRYVLSASGRFTPLNK